MTHLIRAGVAEEREAGDDYFLWFTESAIVTGHPDAAWDMPYTLHDAATPAAIDITRNDRWEPWIDLALIEVYGETLRVCVAAPPGKLRPAAFGSTAENGHTLYVGVRCAEPLPE